MCIDLQPSIKFTYSCQIFCIKFQPDKRMRRPNVSGETKPPLPSMLLFDTEDKKDNTDDDSDGNSTGNEDVNGENEQSGGDTDVLENSYYLILKIRRIILMMIAMVIVLAMKMSMGKMSRVVETQMSWRTVIRKLQHSI